MKKLILITCLLIALLGMARNVVAAPLGYGSNDAGEIHLIDLGSATSIPPSFSTGINFHGLAIDPTGILYGSAEDDDSTPEDESGDLYSIDFAHQTTAFIGNMGIGTVEAMDFNGSELWVTDSDPKHPTIYSIDTSDASRTFIQQGFPEVNDAVTAMTVNTTEVVLLAIPKFPMDFESFDTSIDPFPPSLIPVDNITHIGSLGSFVLAPMIMGMDMAMASDGVLVLCGLANDGGVYSIDQASGDLTKTGDTDRQADPILDDVWLGLAAVDAVATTIIALDIKPRHCPNKLKIRKKGKDDDDSSRGSDDSSGGKKRKGDCKVAILGTENFDVRDIDIATIRLNGVVAPVKSKFKDVTAPAALPVGLPDCNCEKLPKDTYEDLELKFNSQEIISILEPVLDGETRELILTGNLLDGTPIEGKDCVLVKIKGKK